MPTGFDYHRLPAPWIQIKILQMLAILAKNDKKRSEHIYEVLLDVLKRADIGIPVGNAVVYECIRTATSLFPNNPLLEQSAKVISRFITSENRNLKFLGYFFFHLLKDVNINIILLLLLLLLLLLFYYLLN